MKASKQFLYYCIGYLFEHGDTFCGVSLKSLNVRTQPGSLRNHKSWWKTPHHHVLRQLQRLCRQQIIMPRAIMIDEDKVTVVCVVSYMCLCGSISPHCATPLLCTLCSNYSTLQVSGSAVSHETTADQHHS